MSGEIVLLPMMFIAPAAAASMLAAMGAGGMAAFALARGVKLLIDKQVESARRQQAAEKSKICEWQSYVAEQGRQTESLRRLEASLRKSEHDLGSIQLAVGRTAQSGKGSKEKGYVGGGAPEPPEEVQKAMLRLAAVLDALPEESLKGKESPYARLVAQRNSLSGRITAGERVLAEEVLALHATMTKTLQDFLKRTEHKQQNQKAVMAKVEALLDDVVLYEQLARQQLGDGAIGVEDSRLAGILAIRRHLTEFLVTGNITDGQAETLERAFHSVKEDIAAKIVQTAQRTALCESVARNLVEMGYQVVDAFPATERAAVPASSESVHATLRIPGGGLVQATIHPDGKLAFQVQAENADDASGIAVLTRKALAFFRNQEGKWCADLRLLMRRLVAEGFQYELHFERPVPEHLLKVAVVESAEELLEAAEGASEDEASSEDEERRFTETEQKRYLNQ